MESKTDIKLCELASEFDQAFRTLYEGSFPEEEREPEDKLKKLMEAGKLLYHRTLNKDGDLVCFTLVSLAADFSMLAYMATDPTKRSGGYGSKHFKRLIELLKESYPSHVGMFLEIECTKPKQIPLTDDERKVRERRLAFYQRAGAKRMCKDSLYLAPNRIQVGKEWEGELLAVDFGTPISPETLPRIIAEIYQRFYCLDLTDPLVVKVLAQFKHCSSKLCGSSVDGCSRTATVSDTADASSATSAEAGAPAPTEAAIAVPADAKSECELISAKVSPEAPTAAAPGSPDTSPAPTEVTTADKGEKPAS